MKTKAFTLIEVMVVMAIISILAGMMAPVVWRFWESEEIATTRQRMKELKIAMIGDKTLVQNGVRTHYGFVGDFGELPFDNNSSCAFKFLNSKDGMTFPRYNPDNWSGRYLPSSSDANSYALDAWGNAIRCSNKKQEDGRWVGLTLTSITPGGEVLEELIDVSDVTPTSKVVGSITGMINYTSSIKIKFSPDKTGAFSDMSTCITLKVPRGSYEGSLAYKLPIGKSRVDMRFSTGKENCTSPSIDNRFIYFVQDNQREIVLPTINISP